MNIKRTFGWIQNPNVLSSLKNVVSVFSSTSDFNRSLVNYKLPLLLHNGLISQEDYDDFIKLLNNPENGISYDKLRGKGGERGLDANGLPNSKCTGIIQLSIDAQKDIKLLDISNTPITIKKPYTDDWTADGYTRWAISVGLCEYDNTKDIVMLSELGKSLINTKDGSSEEYECFEKALLSYPPVIRLLSIISDGNKYTKFDIGKGLGFTGEMGFTSVPQNMYIAEIETAPTTSDKTKAKENEGDSDKYARTIARWCEQMNWLTTSKKEVVETYYGQSYTMKMHSYTITPLGIRVLRKSKGGSSNAKIHKIVYHEMLATKAPDSVYLRIRRSHIIEFLSNNKTKTYVDIQKYLKAKDIDVSIDTIKDDIDGLIRIGLDFQCSSTEVMLKDIIDKLVIPEEKVEKMEISELKDKIRTHLKTLDHKYLTLVDLAYSDASTKKKKNADAREFEIETASLFTDELGFNGMRLGDSNKPDVIISFNNDGAIIDNKSYKDGFNVDTHCADEMTRYIIQNNNRVDGEPPNEWWKNFDSTVVDFRFLFVTSFLKGKFADNLKSIHTNTGILGAAIGVDNLLYFAEDMKTGKISKQDFFNKMNDCEMIAM